MNLVDWLVKVFRVFKMLSTKTFFITVAIMDSFFTETKN